MKRIICLALCLFLLLIPVYADPAAQAQVLSYDVVCTVSSSGSCDVSLSLSVVFPEGATTFLMPLPLMAEEITTPGLSATVTQAEDRIYLLTEKAGGFSQTDTVSVSYHLPQIVESWDKKQTLTLPLLFDDWNCMIDFYQLQLNLPSEFDAEPMIYDRDGDPVDDFVAISAVGSQLTLETGGKPFVPEITELELEFSNNYFTLPDLSTESGNPEVTQVFNLDAACAVLSDSSCFVSMKAEYRFPGQQSSVRIPVPKDAYDISLSGMQYEREEADDCSVLVITAPSGFSGSQTFDLSYHLLTTAVEEGGTQRFSLPLIFSQWEYQIRSFSLSLTLPSAFEGLPEFVSSYYQDQIDNFLDIRVDNATVLAKSLQPLMEQESLSVQLDLPSGFFDLRYLQGRFSSLETILFWLFFVLCLLYWFFFLRADLRQIVPEAQAPLGCNAGQIPYLLRMKAPSLGLLSATWASLGYLSLERTKSRHLYLLRRMDMKNERSRGESMTFSALFARKTDCRVQSHAYREAQSHCFELTKEDWSDRLLHQKFGKAWPLNILGLIVAVAACMMSLDRLITPQSFRWLLIIPLTVLGVIFSLFIQQLAGLHFVRHPWKRRLIAYLGLIMLMLAGILGHSFFPMMLNCILQFLIGLVTLPGARRSDGGIALFYQLLGLRKYLRKLEVSDLEVLLEDDPQYYYRALPYAEALGIGHRFTKKFAGFRLEPCHWLNWKGLTIDSAEAFYQRFSLMLDEMDSKKR